MKQPGTAGIDPARIVDATKKDYAYGFEGLINFIDGLLPSNEVIGQALRKTVPMFPELAVRERKTIQGWCFSRRGRSRGWTRPTGFALVIVVLCGGRAR